MQMVKWNTPKQSGSLGILTYLIIPPQCNNNINIRFWNEMLTTLPVPLIRYQNGFACTR